MLIRCEQLCVSTYDVVSDAGDLFHFPRWELVQEEVTHIHAVQASLHFETWLAEGHAEQFESI